MPFPSPMHEVKSESEVAQSCPTLNDPMDCSLPGSSVQGIFQARVLEWGDIAFTVRKNRYVKSSQEDDKKKQVENTGYRLTLEYSLFPKPGIISLAGVLLGK